MIYTLFSPSLQVQEFVKHYHLLHYDLIGLSVGRTMSYFPKAEQCLTFDPRGKIHSLNKQTGKAEVRGFSYLSQQQTSTFDLKLAEDYLMLKVVFKPGALFRLFGIPLYELGETYVDAETIVPKEVRDVNEQLAAEQTYEGMIAIVDRYLIDKIKGVKIEKQPIDKAFILLDSQLQNFSLDWIASHACLSVRQLERKYLERIGVGPKVYHRILRFNNAFNMKEKDATQSWRSVALANGYTDHKHLVKDFRRFAGTTPTALIQEEATTMRRRLNL